MLLPTKLPIWSLLFSSGAFEDDDVTHVEGDVNPVRDLEIISEELRLKDMEYLTKRLVSLVSGAVLFEVQFCRHYIICGTYTHILKQYLLHCCIYI